jgi:hypothetical protein
MLLLLPQTIIIGVILATHPETTHKPPPVPEAPAETGTVDWQANIQAIQNLMGLVYVYLSNAPDRIRLSVHLTEPTQKPLYSRTSHTLPTANRRHLISSLC